jgi:hypothetical protein
MLEAKCFIIKKAAHHQTGSEEAGNMMRSLDSQDHIVCLAVY